MIQRAILQVLNTLPEVVSAHSVPTSFGGVPKKGVHDAAMHIRRALSSNELGYFVRSDIKDFFQHLPRRECIGLLRLEESECDFSKLLLDATEPNIGNARELGNDIVFFPNAVTGLAQGSSLSSVLANLYLCRFDYEMNSRSVICIRYVDDFLLLGRSMREVRRAFSAARKLLSGYGMEVHDPSDSGKSREGRVSDGFEFLGCIFYADRVIPSASNRRKLVRTVEGITRKAQADLETARSSGKAGNSFAHAIVDVERRVRGWAKSFSFCDRDSSCFQLDRDIGALVRGLERTLERQRRHATNDAERLRLLGVYQTVDAFGDDTTSGA